MKSEPKLPYGILKGRLVSVKEVSSGLACGCVCPRCKQTLVAKKGEIKVHHFAHHNADPCDYAVEVAVHMLAKQVLEKAGRIKLPELEIMGWPRSQRVCVHKERWVELDRVYTENRFHKVVPEIVVESGGHKLIVEVFATKRLRSEKCAKIREAKVPCIEVNLTQYMDLQDISLISQMIVNEVDRKSWVYSEKAEREKKKVDELKTKIFKRIKNKPLPEFKNDPALRRKKPLEKRPASSLATKSFKCSQCGRETRDWTTCDMASGTCVCYDCFHSKAASDRGET